MKVFLQTCDNIVVIRARAESTVDGERCVGDYVREVLPGGHFGRLSYEQLRNLGSGEYDLDELLSHADADASENMKSTENS